MKLLEACLWNCQAALADGWLNALPPAIFKPYMRLCWFCWCQDGLPRSEEEICELLGMEPERFAEVWSRVSHRFQPVELDDRGEVLWEKRMIAARENALKKQAASAAGVAGRRAKREGRDGGGSVSGAAERSNREPAGGDLQREEGDGGPVLGSSSRGNGRSNGRGNGRRVTRVSNSSSSLKDYSLEGGGGTNGGSTAVAVDEPGLNSSRFAGSGNGQTAHGSFDGEIVDAGGPRGSSSGLGGVPIDPGTWGTVLDRMRGLVSEADFETWVRPLVPLCVRNGVVFLSAPSDPHMAYVLKAGLVERIAGVWALMHGSEPDVRLEVAH